MKLRARILIAVIALGFAGIGVADSSSGSASELVLPVPTDQSEDTLRAEKVSQRITLAPAQRERDRGLRSGTFLPPSALPRNANRPSDHYVPPPRHPLPFYHYHRTTPSLTAPAYQRRQR